VPNEQAVLDSLNEMDVVAGTLRMLMWLLTDVLDQLVVVVVLCRNTLFDDVLGRLLLRSFIDSAVGRAAAVLNDLLLFPNMCLHSRLNPLGGLKLLGRLEVDRLRRGRVAIIDGGHVAEIMGCCLRNSLKVCSRE